VRVATFNISSGRSPADGRVDADRFAAAIAALDADVLSLQEVDRGQPRSGHLDLSEIAARAMGARHHAFVPALYGTPGSHWTPATEQAEPGPAYGCALLSRFPMPDVQVFRMPAAPIALPLWVPGAGVIVVREEPRVAIIARVDVGARELVTIIGTHLPFVPLWKRWQLRRLVAEVGSRPGPVLLLGDLNLVGGTPSRLTGYQSLATGLTFPASRPRVQLDHVLSREPLGDLGSVVAASTPAMSISDHRPVIVDIERSGVERPAVLHLALDFEPGPVTDPRPG
jgi:endonuclease/exonuclease/phosphatase family metal-dependent hydrolase